MATSRDKYYKEMLNTLTDYNDRNNTALSDSNIQESIRKVIEEESIGGSSNVTAYTFGHAFNTQRQNSNAVFTSEKLDKSDKLVDAVNNLTINDAEYYESNAVTTSGAQGYLTRNPETITHTSNGDETVTHTSNSYFGQKLLINPTIPVLPQAMNPGIVQGIAPIVLALQTVLAPVTKEYTPEI